MALVQLCQLLLQSGVNECHKHKEVSSRKMLPTLVREQNSTTWGAHLPTGGVIEAPS